MDASFISALVGAFCLATGAIAQSVSVVDWRGLPITEQTVSIQEGALIVVVDANEPCLVQVFRSDELVTEILVPANTGGLGQQRFEHDGTELRVTIRKKGGCDVYFSIL